VSYPYSMWCVKAVGTGTLAAGTATVATPAAAAGSVIILTPTSPLSALGLLSVSSITPGTGFTVASLNVLDASKFFWALF
jgi:hypothetical protein